MNHTFHVVHIAEKEYIHAPCIFRRQYRFDKSALNGAFHIWTKFGRGNMQQLR